MKSEARICLRLRLENITNFGFTISSSDVPSEVGTYVSYLWDATLAIEGHNSHRGFWKSEHPHGEVYACLVNKE
jgi:hypothetical protein